MIFPPSTQRYVIGGKVKKRFVIGGKFSFIHCFVFLYIETSYTVNVVTGDKRGGGTDANVFMIIFGDNGNSGELALKESSTHKDKFERGNTDVFTFNMLSLGK